MGAESKGPGAWRGVLRPPDDHLVVSEIFGPTVQGEGPNVGTPASFLRLGMCHLSCSWCDTPYTWDASRFDLTQEMSSLSLEVVEQRLTRIGAPRVVITGGEPLLQQRSLAVLIPRLCSAGLEVDIETSGTIPGGSLVGLASLFVVSPKLSNSGLTESARLRPAILRDFVRAGAIFKFVVTSDADLDEVSQVVSDCGVPDERVIIMPEGTAAEDVIARSRLLVDAVVARRWRLVPRLHVMLWGNERGR